MRKATPAVLVLLFGLAAAQTKPGQATYISSDTIQATLKQAPADSVTDQQIRMVDVGKAQVGVGVVYRSAKARQSAVQHDQLTEVYHILDGSGTLTTGGALLNPQRDAKDSKTVTQTNGPSQRSDTMTNGESRRVGPGDMVIIPAGVSHWFSSIDGSIRYVVVRVDVEKVLPLK
jgi:mannose-6-phosphate isomerase-like protein (cupin superfamily)